MRIGTILLASPVGSLVAFYNFCRTNLAHKVKGQKGRTPAMVAGLTDHVWTIAELLKAVAG